MISNELSERNMFGGYELLPKESFFTTSSVAAVKYYILINGVRNIHMEFLLYKRYKIQGASKNTKLPTKLKTMSNTYY